MTGDKNDSDKHRSSREATIPPDSDLVLAPSDLLPGDVLLYRPRNPNMIQRKISSATGSLFTHAAIYIGDGFVAEAGVLMGVTKSALADSIQGNQYIAVFRTQLGFGGDRPHALNEFVSAVLQKGRLYDFITVAIFKKRSGEYFDNQLEFIRENYGKATSREEFAEQSFFCSALVVACYAVVGIIGETAQVAYQPTHFSPGHLAKDPTFGWLLGYLLPEGGSLPANEPLLQQATLWRDCQEVRWW